MMTARPPVSGEPPCGRTDTVTTVEGRELLFRCDRERDHDGRHHAVNVEGIELFWKRSRRPPASGEPSTPLADGTDEGALAVILDEAKDGPWKPEDGTSLWFYNEAGDQLRLTGDDVVLLLSAALASEAGR